jgi:hypothetical protein
MTFVGFILGFWTCGITLGTLWLLRERERARVFKGLREDNERLRAADRGRREFLEYVYSNLQEFNLKLGGLASLPGPANRTGQRLTDRIDRQIVENHSTEPSNGGSHFLNKAS